MRLKEADLKIRIEKFIFESLDSIQKMLISICAPSKNREDLIGKLTGIALQLPSVIYFDQKIIDSEQRLLDSLWNRGFRPSEMKNKSNVKTNGYGIGIETKAPLKGN